MTKHESSIWYLFKECFNPDWVSKKCPVNLLDIRDYLRKLLEAIEERLEQFD